MVQIKSLDRIKRNFKSGTAGAQGRYKEGVESPRRPWKESTLAASDLQKQAMTDALARDAVKKGVEATAADKQQIRASTLGPARYSQGAAAGVEEYGSGFSPYHSKIASTELPPKGPKGSPENEQRSAAMGKALHDLKVSK